VNRILTIAGAVTEGPQPDIWSDATCKEMDDLSHRGGGGLCHNSERKVRQTKGG